MSVRKSEKYVVKPSKTKRHEDSAVPYLQKLLNKDSIEKRQNLKWLLEIPQVVEKDGELKKRKQVNYVSYVDVITYENKNLFIYLFIREVLKVKGKETFWNWELSPRPNLIWDHYSITGT